MVKIIWFGRKDAGALLICFINIDARYFTQILWEQGLKDIRPLPYLSCLLHFECMSNRTLAHIYTHTLAKNKKQNQQPLSLEYWTNPIITMLITVSLCSSLLIVWIIIASWIFSGGKGAHFYLRWRLPLFQGQLTWTTPPPPPTPTRYQPLRPNPSPPLPWSFSSHLQLEPQVKNE